MKRLAAGLFLLLWPALLFAEITFQGEKSVPANSIAKIKAVSPDFKSFIYRVNDAQNKKVKTERGEGGWVLFTGPAGKYTVTAIAGKADKDGNVTLDDADFEVVIGEAPPDPGPGPGPGPGPAPGPSPIPKDGFRTLIVYSKKDLAKLPQAQVDVLYSKTIRDYLNATCAKGTDGKTGEWRIWPDEADATNEEAHWKTAFGRPRKALPSILISTGRSGYEGPLPASVDATLALLKKYAPAATKAKKKGGK